jgi:predicted transcriptional regulator
MSASPFVFSIRPESVAGIFDGSKRFEYRTRCPDLELDETILIYETAPMSRIVGSATVCRVWGQTPETMWKLTHRFAGIDADAFAAYFAGRSMAYALGLVNVRRLPVPLLLPAGMRAPQSWARYKGWAGEILVGRGELVPGTGTMDVSGLEEAMRHKWIER